MKKLTGTFTAHDDFGRDYTIHIYTTYIDARSHTNQHGMTEGLKELITDSGDPVNREEKGVYELNGRVLRSDDPDAP